MNFIKVLSDDFSCILHKNDLLNHNPFSTHTQSCLSTYMPSSFLGYFQGMNDLLAVIMTIIEGEEDAFWCFAGLLERIVSFYHPFS